MNKVKDYFNSRSSGYENAMRHNPLWKAIKEKEKEEVLRLLSPQENEHILDAGSGAGFYAAILKNRGCTVTCIDIAPSMIQLVREKGIEARVTDIEDFFLDCTFNKIICLGVLEFTPHPEKALRNLEQHLEKSGAIVIIVPLCTLLGYVYKVFYFFHRIKIHLFSAGEIKALLNNSGLEVEDSVKLFNFSYVIKVRLATHN